MDRRAFISASAVALSGCLTDDTGGSDGAQNASDDWSARDLNRTGETPYESEDEDGNILSRTGRDLAIEGGAESHELRVEVRDDGETFYSVEGVVAAGAMFSEQNVVRKRGVHEVRVYIDGEHAKTFGWRVDDGHSTALVRLENGVTTRVGEVSGALNLVQADGYEGASSLNETDLLEHDAIAEAFDRAEDCADDPGREGCNSFADEDTIGVEVTGVKGEELDAVYRSLGSVGERDTGAYVEKDGVVYELSVSAPL